MQDKREDPGGFSPFLKLWFHRYIDCVNFQTLPHSPTKQILMLFSCSCKVALPQPPSHTYTKKCTEPLTWKVIWVGHFQHVNVSNLNLQVYFFHLLWYAYLIHCPRLDLIWWTLVQGWWWASSEGPRQRVVFSVLSVAHYFWSTELPHGFICTWNAESISTYWLWIMTAKKEA